VTLLHVYRATPQLATDWRLEDMGRVTCSPRALRWASCCHRNRWAGNLVAHVQHDTVLFFCVEGKGCKKGDAN